MKFPSIPKFNLFLLAKLPAAWFTGVRLKKIDAHSTTVSVKHRWINQNPFKSMFWAVQGMAAELATGALVIGHVQNSDHKISTLVTSNNAKFSKKATGRITFICNDGHLVEEAVAEAIKTGKGQTCALKAIGTNKEGIQVSEFIFEWSLKVRS